MVRRVHINNKILVAFFYDICVTAAYGAVIAYAIVNITALLTELKHIFIYDKLGKCIELFSPVLDYNKIKTRIGNTTLKFEWKDLGVKFFSNKETCEKAAKEYLERVTQFVSLKTFKKILRLMNIQKEIVFYRRNKKGKVEATEVDEVNWFDKQTLTLVSIYYWDDGEGYGGEDRVEYPLSTYGKDWALTREELENGR